MILDLQRSVVENHVLVTKKSANECAQLLMKAVDRDGNNEIDLPELQEWIIKKSNKLDQISRTRIISLHDAGDNSETVERQVVLVRLLIAIEDISDYVSKGCVVAVFGQGQLGLNLTDGGCIVSDFMEPYEHEINRAAVCTSGAIVSGMEVVKVGNIIIEKKNNVIDDIKNTIKICKRPIQLIFQHPSSIKINAAKRLQRIRTNSLSISNAKNIVSNKRVENVCNTIFQKYDVHNNNNLDIDELKHLLLDIIVSWTGVIHEEDEDGNGDMVDNISDIDMDKELKLAYRAASLLIEKKGTKPERTDLVGLKQKGNIIEKIFLSRHPLGMKYALNDSNQIVIQSIDKNSQSYDKNIHVGWILHSINDKLITSMKDLNNTIVTCQNESKLVFEMSKEVPAAHLHPADRKDTDHHLFDIDVSEKFGMTIDHPEEDQSHYPAVITRLTQNGQADKKGVQVGMHIHTINGNSCRDQKLEYVLSLVQNAKLHSNMKMSFIIPENPDNDNDTTTTSTDSYGGMYTTCNVEDGPLGMKIACIEFDDGKHTETHVMEVDPSSQADKHRIKPGYIIVEIAGKSIDGKRYDNVVNLFQTLQRPFTLKLLRNSSTSNKVLSKDHFYKWVLQTSNQWKYPTEDMIKKRSSNRINSFLIEVALCIRSTADIQNGGQQIVAMFHSANGTDIGIDVSKDGRVIRCEGEAKELGVELGMILLKVGQKNVNCGIRFTNLIHRAHRPTRVVFRRPTTEENNAIKKMQAIQRGRSERKIYQKKLNDKKIQETNRLMKENEERESASIVLQAHTRKILAKNVLTYKIREKMIENMMEIVIEHSNSKDINPRYKRTLEKRLNILTETISIWYEWVDDDNNGSNGPPIYKLSISLNNVTPSWGKTNGGMLRYKLAGIFYKGDESYRNVRTTI
jgi:transcriptional regulator NrdR family protein